jgi:hypothetical protein
MTGWLNAVFTFVIASATIAYVILTKRLWKETKRTAEAAVRSADATTIAANAARASADAARIAAETASQMQRPFLGLVDGSLENNPNDQYWRFPLTVRNHGVVPAVQVTARFQFRIGGTVVLEKVDPNSAEIFPASNHHVIIAGNVGKENLVRIVGGHLILNTTIHYAAPDGRKFVYEAEARLSDSSRFLSVVKSETRTI